MSTKHTPGPWKMVRPDITGATVESAAAHGVTIAWCGTNGAYGVGGSHTIGKAEATANAHLIAAAPELLEALTRLRDCYSVSHSPATRQSCWEQAHAAIAKATGT